MSYLAVSNSKQKNHYLIVLVHGWMCLKFHIYILEDSNDKYSDEHEINNPLIDKYEIKNKPEENEYPVVVYMYRVQGYFNVDWFSIRELNMK